MGDPFRLAAQAEAPTLGSGPCLTVWWGIKRNINMVRLTKTKKNYNIHLSPRLFPIYRLQPTYLLNWLNLNWDTKLKYRTSLAFFGQHLNHVSFYLERRWRWVYGCSGSKWWSWIGYRGNSGCGIGRDFSSFRQIWTIMWDPAYLWRVWEKWTEQEGGGFQMAMYWHSWLSTFIFKQCCWNEVKMSCIMHYLFTLVS